MNVETDTGAPASRSAPRSSSALLLTPPEYFAKASGVRRTCSESRTSCGASAARTRSPSCIAGDRIHCLRSPGCLSFTDEASARRLSSEGSERAHGCLSPGPFPRRGALRDPAAEPRGCAVRPGRVRLALEHLPPHFAETG